MLATLQNSEGKFGLCWSAWVAGGGHPMALGICRWSGCRVQGGVPWKLGLVSLRGRVGLLGRGCGVQLGWVAVLGGCR